MSVVGSRTLPRPAPRPSAQRLRESSAVNAPLAALLPGGRTGVPKGVYRYRTLDDADRQLQQWTAEAMARTHAARRG